MRINFEKLKKIAETSKDGEAYITIEKVEGCRIGVGVRARAEQQNLCFVELVLSLCPKSEEVNTQLIEDRLLLLRELEKRGYSMNCDGDNYVSCELCITSEELEKEVEKLRKLVSPNHQDIVV